MDVDQAKPGASNVDKRLVNMAELEVASTELAYVTGVDEEDMTFFAQLCKFTNNELLQHNQAIHDFCKNLALSKTDLQARRPSAPKVGDVLCTQYALDANWYRVVVKRCDEEKRECKVYFTDYGNIETVGYDYLVEVSPSELPAIERAPFGFYCKLTNYGKVPGRKLLDALSDEYIMFKSKERIDKNLWRVFLPNVAYNQALVSTIERTAA